MKSIFLEIQQRIEAEIPEIKWIDEDLGQLENYTDRPSVLFPCVLMDFDDGDFSDMADHAQMCDYIIKMRVGFNVMQHSNQVTPAPVRNKALYRFDILDKIFDKLHGWSGTNFGELTRLKQTAEPRNDLLRVYVIQFRIGFEQYQQRTTQLITVPPMSFDPSLNTSNGGVFGNEFDQTFD